MNHDHLTRQGQGQVRLELQVQLGQWILLGNNVNTFEPFYVVVGSLNQVGSFDLTMTSLKLKLSLAGLVILLIEPFDVVGTFD